MRFVILGGGPAGHQAATYAARLGAQVTVIERDVFGGAANLWDCIPSKTMIATGGAISYSKQLPGMGLTLAQAEVDIEALTNRIRAIERNLNDDIIQLLQSQGVRMIRGTGRFTSPHSIEATGPEGTQTIEFDTALVSTGSRPRIPDWCSPDGERILTTRECYPPKVFPESITVVGSGVTGVEFVHMFSSFGAQVNLVVSRQHVLPGKDPEVAGVLEDDFVARGVKLLKGARAEAIDRDDETGGVVVRCDDGRVVRSSHAVLAIGSVPNTDRLGLEAAGVELDDWGYIPINHHCVTNQSHIYAAGDVSGKLPLASVASMQGRKVAEHVMGLHTVEHRHLDRGLGHRVAVQLGERRRHIGGLDRSGGHQPRQQVVDDDVLGAVDVLGRVARLRQCDALAPALDRVGRRSRRIGQVDAHEQDVAGGLAAEARPERRHQWHGDAPQFDTVDGPGHGVDPIT